MRTMPSINLAAFKNSNERSQVKTITDMLRQVNGGLARSIFPGTQPAANPVSPSPSPSGLPTPSSGDMLYGTVIGNWTKLTIGPVGSILKSTGGIPQWATAISLLPIHDHSGGTQGGNIPESSVTNLVTDLGAKAPSNATYITQTASGGLSAEQNLDALATGLLKSTNGTGVVTIAAAADLPTHGAAQHTDRTRSVFLPWEVWTDASGTTPISEALGTFPDKYSGIPMVGAVAKTQLLAYMVIPQDYTSGSVSWKIFVATQGISTNNVHFNLSYKVVANNGSLVAAADTTMSSNTAMTGTIDQLVVIPGGTTTTNLSAGGFVRLSVERDPTDAADTNTDDVDFIGLQFDYTADM